MQNYRNAFLALALHHLTAGQKKMVVKTLDTMNKRIPAKVIAMETGLMYEMANLYNRAGSMEKYKEIAAEVEKRALKEMAENPNDVDSYYNPYRILINIYENLKEYKKLTSLWEKIYRIYPNDYNVKANIIKYQKLAMKQDSIINSNKNK